MYFYITFQCAYTECFSEIFCENIDRYLFLMSDRISLREPTLRTYFLVALLCSYVQETLHLLVHLSCFCFHPLPQHCLVYMLVFRASLLLDGTCIFRLLRSMHVVWNLGPTHDVFLTSICLRKPHLEHNWNRSYLPQMQEIMWFSVVFPKTRASISRSRMRIEIIYMCISITIYLFTESCLSELSVSKYDRYVFLVRMLFQSYILHTMFFD